jgi:hypothetical protein
MRNPNETTTSITETTDKIIIEFVYTSASVANADFTSIINTYNTAEISINGKIITVVESK